MQGTNESLGDAAQSGSGLAIVYRALDQLVDLYGLDDAAVVVDVPEFGRQVLRAGRLPLRDDPFGLHDAAPGLYLHPPLDDRVLTDLMVALGTLGLRFDDHATRQSAAEATLGPGGDATPTPP